MADVYGTVVWHNPNSRPPHDGDFVTFIAADKSNQQDGKYENDEWVTANGKKTYTTKQIVLWRPLRII
jgi:hypothetical protein